MPFWAFFHILHWHLQSHPSKSTVPLFLAQEQLCISEVLRRMMLNNKFGPGVAAAYYGDTPDDERLRIVQDFQSSSNLRFFVGNPATAGYGLTLTEANLVVYYANDFNLETRMQSEDRAHRIGQHNPVTYVDLITEGSIDEKIVKALRAKIDIGAKVLGEEARQWLTMTPKK